MPTAQTIWCQCNDGRAPGKDFVRNIEKHYFTCKITLQSEKNELNKFKKWCIDKNG